MPTDTQRAASETACGTMVGDDVRVALADYDIALEYLVGGWPAMDEAHASLREDAKAARHALIIAIAKRVREAEEDVGVAIIAAERRRQMEREGYTTEHDDTHADEEMASCAACYAMPAECRRLDDGGVPAWWPFGCCDWKPTPQDRVRELAKAGALIAAEIGRLKRLEVPDA